MREVVRHGGTEYPARADAAGRGRVATKIAHVDRTLDLAVKNPADESFHLDYLGVISPQAVW